MFLLSFSRADELSAAAVAAGWRVDGEGGQGITRSFADSAATLAVVDTRGASEEALAAATAIGGVLAAKRGALLVLVSHEDVRTLGAFHAAGATHFLASPFSDAEFVEALRFAQPRTQSRVLAAAPDEPLDWATARDWIERHEQPSVIIIALSRFDLVNSGYGRDAGDALITAAVRRIAGEAGARHDESHVVARLKGPEFLIAVAGDVDAEALARALSATLERPFAIDGALVAVGARVGVATARAGESGDALLRRANDALDDARASDGATIRIAGDAANADALSVDLRRAIEAREIGVLFQPQVAIATGRITGVEALARWEHPTFGPVGADQLFAAADRADLGLALSDHIQRLALQTAAAWPESLSALRLSINLTAADIARPGFADLFLDRVDASRFARSRLTVEIIESGLIDDLGAAAHLLAVLRHAGCRVAIDDFGTGYSSLAYLKALPLDYLKIDKKLAQDIAGTPRDRVVVRGVIEMARSLGLTVIAEGVETDEQLDLLAKEGCQYYQGFLCAEPLTVAALATMVAANEHGRIPAIRS
ncbi:MAG: GGDEF domain-containing protein [Sphingomonas sp.]|nr:MAG: GGDEF domain-containing protein [Sphingomonas sp.]